MAFPTISGAGVHQPPALTQTIDKEAIEKLVVSVPDDELSALCTTDLPITDLVALLKLDAVGDVNNVSWDKVWDAVEKANAHEVCLVESHASHKKSLDKVTPMSLSIQSRNVAASGRDAGTVIAAVAFVVTIIQWIVDQNWDDHKRRSEFTQVIVRDLRKNDPKFNYVICYTNHQVRFDGTPGIDFTQKRVSLPIWWGFGSITYDLYAFRAGTFQLLGDGGYLNWAYSGDLVSDSGDPGRPRNAVFRRPT